MASDPAIARSPYYVCPICQAPVHLRRGGGKVAHFAHNSKQAKASCELYNENSDKHLKEREAPYRKLGLYLRLSDEHKPPINWSLEIGIPESDVDVGRIRIPFSWGGQRIIPVSAIKSGGHRVRITPGVGPFTILQDDIPEGRWKSRITQPILGLDIKKINAFPYSPFGGRRLNEGKPFYWGRAYVLLWVSNYSPKWWPFEEIIQPIPLRGYSAWSGVYVQFPAGYNRQVEEWAMEHTGRSILHPPAELELITPFPEYRLPDGSYVISNGNRVSLGIIGEPGVRKWREIFCHCLNTEVTQRISGRGIVPSVIQLPLAAGRNNIWLDDDMESSLQIIVNSKIEFIQNIPGVKLFARDRESSKEHEVLLHNKEAEQLIRAAYEGNIMFTDVNIPSYVNIRLNWVNSNTKEEQSLYRTYKDEPKELQGFEEKVLELLNNLAVQTNSCISIDAGVFGSLKVGPSSILSSTSLLRFDMGDKWRERALYLLTLAKTITTGRFINIHRKLDISSYCDMDQKILARIASQRRWPVALAPYCWNLLNECQRMHSLNSLNYGREQNGH